VILFSRSIECIQHRLHCFPVSCFSACFLSSLRAFPFKNSTSALILVTISVSVYEIMEKAFKLFLHYIKIKNHGQRLTSSRSMTSWLGGQIGQKLNKRHASACYPLPMFWLPIQQQISRSLTLVVVTRELAVRFISSYFLKISDPWITANYVKMKNCLQPSITYTQNNNVKPVSPANRSILQKLKELLSE
jgi:hypothetical protein